MAIEVGLREEDWDYELVEDLTGGIDLSVRSEKLPLNKHVSAVNIFFEDGQVKVDTGYTTFGQAVLGTPRADYQFFKTNGTSEFVLVTNTTLYKWNASQSEWQFVTGATSTTGVDIEPAGETEINLTSSSGFTDGCNVGITLDDGSMHMTTQAGAPAGNVITIDDAIPTGRQVDAGAAVIIPPVLTGSDSENVDMCTVTFSDWFVFTNGVDEPQRYDGTDCIDVPNLPSSGNTKCKAIYSYANYLCMLHTIEGGTAYPQRVRWCDTADPTNWSSGNAGYEDQFDGEDFFKAGVILGPYAILYRERSIMRQEFVGTDDTLFNIETMVTGEGINSVDSVIDLGDKHAFIGQANIYEYEGGFTIDSIGDAIFSKVFGQDGELNASHRDKIFAIYVEEVDEIWIFYPSTDATFPDKCLRYNISKKTWVEREFPLTFAGYGLYTRSTNITWNDLVGTWLQQTWRWGSTKLTANSPTTHLLDPVNLRVLEYDYSALTDNGTDISWSIETRDYYNPRFRQRVDSMDISCAGTSILVEYSTNKGASWATYGTVTPTAAIEVYMISKQISAKRLRWRFSGTGPGHILDWYGFSFSQESDT